MSRINWKKLLILTMASAVLAASACAQEDILAIDERIQEQINYKTETVRVGNYEKTTTNTGTDYYPLTYKVKFPYNDAKFAEYTVTRGDEVKKGDVLARFTITGSEVQLTRMQLNLTRTEEATAEGVEARQTEIARKRAEMTAEKDEIARKKKELELRKLEIALEQYSYRQQRSIDQQREALDEELERRATNVLISPVDGVVTDLTYKKVDDAVSKNETLVTIYSEDVKLIRVDNSTGGFRYNLPVTVTSGSGDKMVTVTGRVVASDNAIPESERTGHAFILLDPYDESTIRLRSMKVIAPSIYLEDVLLVKRSAVTLEAGKYYITKLVDGMVQKRYIEYGMGNTADVWIMNGVSEGDTLIIN